MTYVKQTWANGPVGATPLSASRLNYIEDGIAGLSSSAIQLIAPATGVRATDNANLQAALDALPSEGGKIILSDDLSGGGVYRAENLTASNLEYLEIDGQGATIKLADNDGLGGLGQILVTTDVIALTLRNLTFHGNYANAKSSSQAKPLVQYTTTVATNGRKDFRVLVEDVECIESAKGYGHLRFGLYEINSTTFSEFAWVAVRRFRSVSHGDLGGALNIRGPAASISWEDCYAENGGEFGFVARGVPSGGSSGNAFGASAEVGFNHFIKVLKIRNVVVHRAAGALFTQMVKILDVDGFYSTENSINPYYDAIPSTFTADAGTDVISATVPSGYGNSSVVKVTSSGTPPAPLVNGNLYFVRDVSGNTFKLALFSGGAAINLTDTGTGTHTIQFMGYTYGNDIKGDDNKHTPDAPSVHTYRNVHLLQSSPHSGHRALVYEETAVDTCGRIVIQDSEFVDTVDFAAGYPGLLHSARRCTFRKGWMTNVDFGNSTVFQPRGAMVEECYFDAVWDGQTFMRDTTVRGCKFKLGAIFKFGASVVFRLLDNTWNTDNTGTQFIEVTPPAVASGLNLTAVVNGNRVPAGTAVQSQFRVTGSRDLAAFQLFYRDNDFYTSATGDANSTSLQILARDNRNFRRSETEYPFKTLSNAAQPDAQGGKAFLTGGTTAITNFANGIQYNRILVYIATGHTVNHNGTTIVTRSGANIAGPAVREFVLYGSIWYEL